jgi:hypothetical protein
MSVGEPGSPTPPAGAVPGAVGEEALRRHTPAPPGAWPAPG